MTATTALRRGKAATRRPVERPVMRRVLRPARPDQRAHQVSSPRRARGVAYFIMFLVGLIVVGLIRLQVVSPERYVRKGLGQRTIRTELIGLRGSILDRHGDALAMSLPAKAITADPRQIADPDAVAKRLAPVLGREVLEVRAALGKADTGFVYIARQVEPEVATKIDRMGLGGITIIDESRRFNTGGDLARSVVGRMDSVGEFPKFGLEKLFDERLRGENGQRVVERGSDGSTIVGTEQVSSVPTEGQNVTLTLDRNLQFIAERVLGEQCARLGADSASVIIGRPKTGEILAMASVTTTPDGGWRTSQLNGAVRIYEPGSVMKVVTAAAAFEQGVVQPTDEIMVEPSIKVGTHTVRDAHSHPTMPMTVTQIIAESSNVGTIHIAEKLGREKILTYLDRFGFGKMTNLGLPKEQAGSFRREWNGSDIGSIPIGQSITATPLQIWSMYNSIANRGVYVSPKLVDHWTDSRGRVLNSRTPAPRRVLTESAAAKVTGVLEQVIDEGTGRKFAIPGFNIAAKTGTAYETWGNGYGYRNELGQLRYAASFVGFFPASNPQLSIMVRIDNPKTDHGGATAAGPVFDRLAKESMRRYGIGGDVLLPAGPAVRATAAPAPATTTTTMFAPAPSPVGVGPVGVGVGPVGVGPAADGSTPLSTDEFDINAPPPDAVLPETPAAAQAATPPSGQSQKAN